VKLYARADPGAMAGLPVLPVPGIAGEVRAVRKANDSIPLIREEFRCPDA